MTKKKGKFKRSVFALIPDAKDMVFFAKALVVCMMIFSFVFIFLYAAHPSKASSATSGNYSNLGTSVCSNDQYAEGKIKSACTSAIFGIFTEPVTGSAHLVLGNSEFDSTDPASAPSGFQSIDFGATGRLVNASQNIYSTQIAQPAQTISYYAHRAQNKAYAANPTSGREALTPIFFLSQTMRNLAYGIIVIVLIVSSLSILLSTLMGGEQKLSIVQLMINTGISLALATFFYEIAAIIYDLTVNYGNAVVASIMEPFINAKVILERLQPGGDANITVLMNTFQFIGVSDAFGQIMKNVTAGLGPAITQSTSAIAETAVPGPGGVIGWFMGLFSGGVSIGLNYVASNLLGSTPLFDAVISWTIFILNVKIFFNLIDAFVKYNMYVAFGPLLVLQGINSGFEKVNNLFKLLVAYGLVFPVTFLFILLAATVMNIFIRNDSGQTVDRSVLCIYNTSDPANTEDGILGRSWVGETVNGVLGFEDTKTNDPKAFRNRNFISQNIFDTKPAFENDGVRSCRSSLFPVPWTFVPAPFGNFGNRLVQAQTIDSLIRTFLGLAFVIMAGRVPNLMIELLEAKELRSLQGLGKAIASGLAPTVGFGIAGVSNAIGMFKGTLGIGLNGIRTKGLKKFEGSKTFTRLQQAGTDYMNNTQSLGGLYKKFTGPVFSDQNSYDAFTKVLGQRNKQRELMDNDPRFRNMNDDQKARLLDGIMGPSFQQQFQKSAEMVGSFGNALGGAVGGLNGFIDALSKNVEQIRNLTNLLSAEAFDKV